MVWFYVADANATPQLCPHVGVLVALRHCVVVCVAVWIHPDYMSVPVQ